MTRGVWGIIFATFFSDVGHEMVTAVLPLYLASVGLGAAALGVIEGAADFLFSVSKLAGGLVGHRAERKRPFAAVGYLLTTLGTAGMALVHSSFGLIVLRSLAWFGRGFRSPLRDFLLSDEVGPTHFGRAYGLERSADMLGAVAGPLVATALVVLGFDFGTIILISFVPSLVSVASIFSLTRDRPPALRQAAVERGKIPATFYSLLVGVFLFGLGDFSRTFLILLAVYALGGNGDAERGTFSTALLLYVIHNLVSAIVAYPVGHVGDRFSKRRLLLGGYALGVGTNVLLAFGSSSLALLSVAIVASGAYIAVEETLEKAVATEILPRDCRSLGLGLLATANALGDMISSIYVGILISAGRSETAFAIAAACGAAGTSWLLFASRRR
jgi:MFS family permease